MAPIVDGAGEVRAATGVAALADLGEAGGAGLAAPDDAAAAASAAFFFFQASSRSRFCLCFSSSALEGVSGAGDIAISPTAPVVSRPVVIQVVVIVASLGLAIPVVVPRSIPFAVARRVYPSRRVMVVPTGPLVPVAVSSAAPVRIPRRPVIVPVARPVIPVPVPVSVSVSVVCTVVRPPLPVSPPLSVAIVATAAVLAAVIVVFVSVRAPVVRAGRCMARARTVFVVAAPLRRVSAGVRARRRRRAGHLVFSPCFALRM